MRSPAEVLYNFHWVAPGEASRSAQAYAGFLGAFLRGRGIRSVINLRGANRGRAWWRSEKRTCERLGIAHFDVRVNSRTLPARQTLLDLLDAFDRARRPFLIKCSGGQDRTSFASAIYLVDRFGWIAAGEAQQQFAGWPYLHMPKRHQRWARLFLTYAREQAGELSLRQWIAADYTPEGFMGWLDARGMEDSFRNLPGQHARILKS
jgi:protein tyrosine/serine phosphatase